MESYNKWRKMVYDVCRKNLFLNCSVEKYGDTLEAGYESWRELHEYGICSCNTKAFSEFSYLVRRNDSFYIIFAVMDDLYCFLWIL